MKPKGYVVYEGKSPLGQDIVGIVTLKTSNRKTGDMAQLWILARDISPLQARQEGLDSITCGTCPLRAGKGCYVNVGQAPLSIWRAYHRDVYPRADLSRIGGEFHDALENKGIRLGAYGDPAMIPIWILHHLVMVAKNHTGYTHQWRNSWCDQNMKTLLQASCDNEKMQELAARIGWKTFRHAGTAGKAENEEYCKSDTQGMQCADCLGCDGKTGNFVVARHGSMKGRIK